MPRFIRTAYIITAHKVPPYVDLDGREICWESAGDSTFMDRWTNQDFRDKFSPMKNDKPITWEQFDEMQKEKK